MIRRVTKDDFIYINEIGSSIHENFNEKNNIEDWLEYNYTDIYVYEEEGKIIAFLQIENHFEITDIINIAVSRNHLKRGIASSLLEYLINNTKAEKIMLEVRSNNVSAINLYKKYSFKEINIRKNYYGNEDAIVMERRITHAN